MSINSPRDLSNGLNPRDLYILITFSLSNDTTIYGTLNISGKSQLVNDTTIVSSLNVSGLTTLSNNTTIFGTLNISGKSQLVNDTTIVSSLNVSGLTTLFNEIFSRKINNEKNCFEGILTNYMFIIIWLFCFFGVEVS